MCFVMFTIINNFFKKITEFRFGLYERQARSLVAGTNYKIVCLECCVWLIETKIKLSAKFNRNISSKLRSI
jgi:hypothetical protein